MRDISSVSRMRPNLIAAAKKLAQKPVSGRSQLAGPGRHRTTRRADKVGAELQVVAVAISAQHGPRGLQMPSLDEELVEEEKALAGQAIVPHPFGAVAADHLPYEQKH